MDIHNTVELLDGVKILGVFGKKVGADGKVDLTDLPLLIELAQKSSDFAKAVEGLDQIPAEIKDIDAVEAQELVMKIFAIIAEIKAA